ncbi:MAG: TetR/AcrR family transcriptional regulator [Lachnospiraceae bacterium]|nr:TetR/AcrR family transcriptional regulator [Lachnospiraceae bacterium]MDD3617023.1 TetR/AcrR family transcriptional regulator [Lachnospiraceae bacterium]
MTKGETSKTKIIEAAGELFWRDGYTKTGISAILKATGLPKGSFYFYFKSKTEVAEAVLQYYSNIIIDFLRAKAEGAITWDVFCESFIRGFKEELGDRPYYGCPLAVIGMEISFQEENLVKKYRTELEKIRDIFAKVLQKDKVPQEKLEAVAGLCLSVYEGNLLLYRIGRSPEQLEQMERELKEVGKVR